MAWTEYIMIVVHVLLLLTIYLLKCIVASNDDDDIYLSLYSIVGLRVSSSEEDAGLDESYHGRCSIYLYHPFTYSSIYLYLIIYLPFLRRIFDGVIESWEANQQSWTRYNNIHLLCISSWLIVKLYIHVYVNIYMYASIVLYFRGYPAYPFPGLVWERCEGTCIE